MMHPSGFDQTIRERRGSFNYDAAHHDECFCFVSTLNFHVRDYTKYAKFSLTELAAIAVIIIVTFSIVFILYNVNDCAGWQDAASSQAYVCAVQAVATFFLGLLTLSAQLDSEIGRKIFFHFIWPYLAVITIGQALDDKSELYGIVAVKVSTPPCNAAVAVVPQLPFFIWMLVTSLSKILLTEGRKWPVVFSVIMLRTEDEPYSCLYRSIDSAQLIALIYVLIYAGFEPAGLLIWTTADAMSALVGKFVGKNAYTVIDVMSCVPGSKRGRWMQRTFEGSLAFCLTSLISINYVYPQASANASLFSAVLLTIVEAIAPHSLDNVFLMCVAQFLHEKLLKF